MERVLDMNHMSEDDRQPEGGLEKKAVQDEGA